MAVGPERLIEASASRELAHELAHELALANRILARHGVLDAFGHVSARSPVDPASFLLARSAAPASIEAKDIMTFGLDGVARGDERRPYLERYIHGAIYGARPDVMAVVHSHAPSLIPYGVVASRPLRPIYHMAAGMGASVPVFDIADECGFDTDLLIRTPSLGEALARSLAGDTVVLMRGHGMTVAAASVRQAVFIAHYAELNARLQTQAVLLGEVRFLSRGEIAAAWATNAQVVDRAWSQWTAEVAVEPMEGQQR